MQFHFTFPIILWFSVSVIVGCDVMLEGVRMTSGNKHTQTTFICNDVIYSKGGAK